MLSAHFNFYCFHIEIMKTLKEKVLACEGIFGTHVCLSEPVIAEIFGNAGYDFLWIDTEHSAIDLHTLSMSIGCLKYTGTPAIVRVPMHDRNQVKKVLEMGADGVIFPMINTAEEADAAMKSCLYPPDGNRGFGPIRAQRYGFRDLQDYLANAKNEICRFIQIETETAVRNLPEIVKNPWIDGYIIGPFDLSGSIGELSNVFGQRTLALIEETVSILKAHNKCIGISTGSSDPAVFQRYADMGINMISTAGDLTYLFEGARQNVAHMKNIFGR
jgi:2-dehydro-3-deoxyglucarate aldolase/4-hydroxy-2-oxoheptanedioate aldolase